MVSWTGNTLSYKRNLCSVFIGNRAQMSRNLQPVRNISRFPASSPNVRAALDTSQCDLCLYMDKSMLQTIVHFGKVGDFLSGTAVQQVFEKNAVLCLFRLLTTHSLISCVPAFCCTLKAVYFIRQNADTKRQPPHSPHRPPWQCLSCMAWWSDGSCPHGAEKLISSLYETACRYLRAVVPQGTPEAESRLPCGIWRSCRAAWIRFLPLKNIVILSFSDQEQLILYELAAPLKLY